MGTRESAVGYDAIYKRLVDCGAEKGAIAGGESFSGDTVDLEWER